VRQVDEVKKGEVKDYQPCPIPAEHDQDLNDVGITSYAWGSYSARFDSYKQIVERCRDGKYSAGEYFGSINRDWSPFGYSKTIGLNISLRTTQSFELTKSSKEKVSLPDFGARAFLIRNAKIEDLDNVILLDFKSPSIDRILDLGGKDGKIRIGS